MNYSECFKCTQLATILRKSLKLLKTIESELSNKPMLTKIQKVFNQSMRALAGLNIDSSDEEGGMFQSETDKVNKKGGMSPKRRNELIKKL